MRTARIVPKWAIRIAGVASLICVPSVVLANLIWTPWVSEENGPAYCLGSDEAAVGFGCRGNFCDDVRLLCETAPFGIVFEDYRWSGFFSEETPSGLGTKVNGGWYSVDYENMHVCHWSWSRPAVVTGIRCRGEFCDDIDLECATPVKYVSGATLEVSATNCSWSGWKSEEQRSTDFGANRYIMGVECRGSYCDDKRFYVCSLVDPGS